jgi:hypothetical protein
MGWAGVGDMTESGEDDEPEGVTEQYVNLWRSNTKQGRVYREFVRMCGRFEKMHGRQPGQGAWHYLTNPDPSYAEELRKFVDDNREIFEELATHRARGGKVFATEAHYARAVLGRMQKPQFVPPADRTSALSREWLLDNGWTPTKDRDRIGNAYRRCWGLASGRPGRINVYATASNGWAVRFWPDNGEPPPPRYYPTAAEAYAAVPRLVNLTPPAIAAPDPIEWIAI